MSHDYQHITTEDKRQTLVARLRGFENEHYQHAINLKVQEASGNTAGADQTNKALKELDTAIEVNQAELDALPSE